MNSDRSARNIRRAGALVAACALTAGAAAQFVPAPVTWENANKESWISFSAAAVSTDGSDATYRRLHQHDAQRFYGVDAFHWKRALDNDQTFTIDARALLDDNEYQLALRYENSAAGTWLEAGWKESRVFYDGSGGFLPTNSAWFQRFDPELSIDRGEIWIAGGLNNEKTTAEIRYSRQYRDGLKDSTSWGDTNLTGGLGTRALVPAFYDIDETRNTLTVDVEYRPDENANYGAGLRWENIDSNDSRNMERRPGESADRFLTQREVNDADLFAIHGFSQWRRGEDLIVSAAAAHTKIDTNFSGSRIYGATYDAVFDPSFTRRQARDEGFATLDGDSRWKQTLITANALYLPAKHWRLSGGLRYENQRQDVISEFDETAVGTTSALITAVEELEGESSRHFDEFLGSVEADYTGIENVVCGFFLEMADGDGNLREDLIEVENGAVDLGRDTSFSRDSSKYGVNVRWYPSTAANGAVGAYHKVRDNGYGTDDDTTPNLSGGDRYPAYIVSQKFSTDDLYVRGSWHPVGTVALVGRYDYQKTDVDSREDGLAGVLSGDMTSHILAATVSWNPIASMIVQGTVNYVYDEIVTPADASAQAVAHVAGSFDNNYRTFSLLTILAVGHATDVQIDTALFQSENYLNFATVSMPYGLTARDRTFGVSVTHRVSENVVVGLRLARADYDDTTSGRRRDFTADMIYGRLQARF